MMHNPRARLLESVRQRLQGPGVLARHRGHDEPDALLVPRLRAAPLVDLLPERILRCSELIRLSAERGCWPHTSLKMSARKRRDLVAGVPGRGCRLSMNCSCCVSLRYPRVRARGSQRCTSSVSLSFSSPVAGSTIRSVWFRRAAYSNDGILTSRSGMRCGTQPASKCFISSDFTVKKRLKFRSSNR
ncbi:hypothetical protein KC347_g212 [Hortaea werneckii]|nr:hypothetical protein KC347_g212 [Hortaea werneckii]